jgi:fucose permease
VFSCRVQITDTFRGSSPVRIAVTGAVGFFVLGVLISVLGPTLPELRSRHGLDATGGAMLLAAYSVGSAVGVGIAGWFRHRAPIQRLLSLGALGLAVGSAGVPAAPNAVAAGAALFIAGLGLGVVDLLLNLLLARAFGGGSGAVLIAASAAFGVSAVLTPLVVGREPSDLTVPYLISATGAVLLLALTATLRVAPTFAAEGHRATREELRLMLLLGGVLLGYVAFESGVASWETTHLRDAGGMSAGGAANAVALFWLGVTVGRLACAPLALRWHPGRLVLASMALATATVAAAAYTPYAVAAYAVTGFVVAPVFPAVVSWHARAVPSSRGATRMFAAGLAGPVLGAPLLGVAADATETRAVPWVLAAFALATALTALVCYRRAESGAPVAAASAGTAEALPR